MTKKNIIMTFVILPVTILTFSVGTYAYFSVFFKDETNENNRNTNLNTDLSNTNIKVIDGDGSIIKPYLLSV